MNATPQLYTAGQIAEQISKAPRLVRRWLKGVRADGECVVRGNLTKQWRLDSLPTELKAELQEAATRRGLATVEALFSERPAWQPEVPWEYLCCEQQTGAKKLQRALMPTLERHQSPILEGSELVEIGLRNYKLEFNREITPDRWRYLFNRTLERDNGAEQFHRTEIFLPGNLKRSGQIAPKVTAEFSEFEPLSDCIARFNDPQKPTGAEIDALWIESVELFCDRQADRDAKKFKRRLLDYLWQRAPFLAASWNALRVNLDRKVKGESSLIDGREEKRGEPRAPAIPQSDLDRMAWRSAKDCGGRTTQAIRELGEQGERSGLTAETLALINAPKKSKSHINRRLFSIVHHESKLIAPYLLGKKAIDDATPSLRRDYSELRSMDVVTGDDFTMPVYSRIRDLIKQIEALTRGQVLLLIDCASVRVLAWSFQPERNYNSLVIRTLMNKVCRELGIPRNWYFENGIWRRAKLVKGITQGDRWRIGRSDAELKPGWEKLGVRFIHAKRARSKPAELVGGLLQNLMERMPGYCGRDERRDCPEITKRNKLAFDAGHEDAQTAFLSFNAWNEELGNLIREYNATPQQGKILGGLSPDGAFEARWPHDDPPQKLDSTCWHLLAHYVSERDVRSDGSIQFKIGGQEYSYFGEATGPLREKRVLAWFDPECPELLGVTDLKERNPVLVPRSNATGFLASLDREGDAGRNYHSELAKVAACNAYPKARFTVLKTKFEPTFRKNLVSPAVVDVAAAFTAHRHDHEAKVQTETRRRSKVASSARKLGLPSALVQRADERTAEGLEMMARAERAMAEAETETAQTGAKKDYFLKPFPTKGKSK